MTNRSLRKKSCDASSLAISFMSAPARAADKLAVHRGLSAGSGINKAAGHPLHAGAIDALPSPERSNLVAGASPDAGESSTSGGCWPANLARMRLTPLNTDGSCQSMFGGDPSFVPSMEPETGGYAQFDAGNHTRKVLENNRLVDAIGRHQTQQWRPEPESNRRKRICSPVRNHSAIGPRCADQRGRRGS